MTEVNPAKNLTANPAPLGLIAFGMTTVLLNIYNANPTIYGAKGPLPMVLAMGIFFGGIAQIIAGSFEFHKGNTFGMTAFTSYGLFWITLSAIWMLPVLYGSEYKVTDSALSAFLFMWGVFTMFMFIGTLNKNRVLQTIFLTLFILFYMLSLGHALIAMGGSTVDIGKNVLKIAGFEGIFCGFTAVYLAMAELINESLGTTKLPIFPMKSH
jgi:hypothetical protein